MVPNMGVGGASAEPLPEPMPPAAAPPEAPPLALNVTPAALPAPCRGQPFTVSISVSGGNGEYNWEVVGGGLNALPGSEPNELTLSGTPTTAATLTVRVTDTAGNAGERAYDLEPRDSCWYGYVAAQGGGPRALHLIDPVLAQRHAPLPPSLGASESVSDFAFSPDGRRLAVRVVDGRGAGRLSVLRAPDWRAIALPQLPSVLGHAWAPSGEVLVFAAGAEAGTELGALRFSGEDEVTALRSVALAGAPVALELLPSTDAQLALWQAVESTRVLQIVPIGADALGPPVEFDGTVYNGSAALLRGPTGVVVSDADAPAALDHIALDGDRFVWSLHDPAALLSPTRRFVARVVAGASGARELQVFRSDEPRSDDLGLAVPSASATGCGRLLAWSRDDAWLACVTDVQYGGEVRLFPLDVASAALGPPSVVRGDYNALYTEASAFERARGFSADGRWLAFALDDRVYVADVQANPPRVAFVQRWAAAEATFARLSFSPDGRWLLEHRGASLALTPLHEGSSLPGGAYSPVAIPTGVLASAPKCGEDARRPDHCGHTGAPLVTWADDSRSFVYQELDGALVALALEPKLDDVPIVACGPDCVGMRAHQP